MLTCLCAQYNSFTGMAEITTSYSQRPIVVRHRQYGMLRPSADILALNLVDIPFKLVTIFFFDVRKRPLQRASARSSRN